MDGSAYNKKYKSELFVITGLILERNKIMQRKKNELVMILATVVAMLAMSVNVWAAQKNPLAQMSTKASAVLYSAPAGRGCDYFTPEYTSKVKISVKSYNTKVVTVKGYTFERNGKYSAGYETTPIAPGNTKIKVKVTVGAKSYTRTCSYTVYKWENPLKIFKIGSKNYCSKLNKSGTVTVSEDSLNGRLVYKLKPDYTLVSMICYVKTGDKYSTVKNIKSGKKLPQGTYGIFMQIKSKKNNKFYNVRLYTE